MSIRNRLILVIAGALLATTVLAACFGDTTRQTDIVQTSVALNKQDNATSTAEVVLARGGNPDEVEVEVGSGSAAELAQIAAAETATAQAAEGIITEGVGGSAGDELAQGAAFEVEVPEGAAESGVIVVDIQSKGAEGTIFVPDIVKITVGSTVKWTNARKAASSSTAHEGQDESWNSDALSKGTFDKEPDSFEHTFTIPGCYTYESQFSGDIAQGAVCVVE